MTPSVAPRPPAALRLSTPIAALAAIAAAGGVLLPSTYAAEAPAWAAQAFGQDIVTLALVAPALVVLAARARRGSLAAYLTWLGLLAYLAYSYVLYAGYTHFSAWFPLYVGLLGLSGWTLAAGLAALRPVSVAAAFRPGRTRVVSGTWLALFGGLYALLELTVIAGAIAAGGPPRSAVVAGLPTDPVLMLDLAAVLPGMAVTGALLRRGRPVAVQLAMPLLAFATAMGTAILSMLVVSGLRLPPLPWPVIGAFIALTGLHALALAALARSIVAGARLPDVERAARTPAPVTHERATLGSERT